MNPHVKNTPTVDDNLLDAMMSGMASRRGFMAATGAAGLGLAIAGCGSSDSGSSGAQSPDAAVAMSAASLEVLAVSTYRAALDAALAGKLGPVPPAVGVFVVTALTHHSDALAKWNGILTKAGAAPVTAPPADLAATVNAAFAKVTDVGGAAKLALLLEQTAADTYLKAVSVIQNPAAITLAGALQSVDQEHAAILLYVLGMYPVPDVFQKGDKAYSGSGTT